MGQIDPERSLNIDSMNARSALGSGLEGHLATMIIDYVLQYLRVVKASRQPVLP